MAFTLDKILFSPIIEPISITHTVGFGSSLSRVYSVQNVDTNEVKINIKTPSGISVSPAFIQLAPNQTQNVVITADRTFFDTLPKGENNFNISFEFVGQGDPIDPVTDVIVFQLQLTSTPSLNLKVAQTATVTAQVLEKNLTKQTQVVANNKIITFQSSNTNIASVGQLSGVVTGVSPGNAQITVASQGAGQAIVLVGVYADPPAPRWWEKVVVNQTSAQKFFAGPFTTPVQPYPTRETRNGILYDVYYVEVSEDRINTTTYYYDWKDITANVQQLTDAEKLAAGYVSSMSKPAAPSPETINGTVVRVVTNARYEERIVAVNVPVTPSNTPSPSPLPPGTGTPISVTPTPTKKYIQYCQTIGRETSRTYYDATQDYVCRDEQDLVNGGCKQVCGLETVRNLPSQSPFPVTPVTPTPSPIIVAPTCYEIPVWFDRMDTYIDPPPTVGYEDCNGMLVETLVSFNSSATNPDTICARRIMTTFRIQVGNAYASANCVPDKAIPPTPTPSPLPAQTVTFGVFGGQGTINGRMQPFNVTVPFGTGIAVDCVPATGYAFSYAESYNVSGISTGRMTQPNFMVYANGNLDEVRAYFTAIPTGGTSGGTSGGAGGGSQPYLK